MTVLLCLKEPHSGTLATSMALEIQVDPKMWSLEAVPSNSHFQIIPRKFKGAQ